MPNPHMRSPLAQPTLQTPEAPTDPWGEKIIDYVRDNGTDPAILQSFRDLIDSGMPTIYEEHFKIHLLPLSYYEAGVEKDIRVWLRATGSLTNGVRVTDADGEVLLVTPGLFPEMPLYKDADNKTLNWAQLAEDTIRRNGIHPGYGEQRLEMIGTRYLPNITEEVAEAHREKWVEIWKRYGVGGQVHVDTPAPVALRNSAVQETEEEDEI